MFENQAPLDPIFLYQASMNKDNKSASWNDKLDLEV